MMAAMSEPALIIFTEKKAPENTFGLHQYDGGAVPVENRFESLDRQDGVARVVIGGNEDSPMNHYKGLSMSSNPSRDCTLHRVERSTNRPVVFKDTGVRTYRTSPTRRRGYSTSPTRRRGDGISSSNYVEEEFKFVSPQRSDTSQIRLDESQRLYQQYLADRTNITSGRSMSRSSHSADYGSMGRRKGKFESIRDYEEAQRNGTLSSVGLQAYNISENIAPQVVVASRARQYQAQNPVKWAEPRLQVSKKFQLLNNRECKVDVTTKHTIIHEKSRREIFLSFTYFFSNIVKTNKDKRRKTVLLLIPTTLYVVVIVGLIWVYLLELQ